MKLLSKPNRSPKSVDKQIGNRSVQQKLQSAPAPLSAEYLGQISGMYQALTNAVSESLYGQRVFEDAPSLDSVATSLES